MDIPDSVFRSAERAVGARIESARRLTGGYTPQVVCRLALDDGATAILKVAPPPDRHPEERVAWSTLLERETRVYRELAFLRPWQPEFYASGRTPDPCAGEWVWLLIEDLGPRAAPPPWTVASVDAVGRSLAGLHAAAGDPDRLPAWLQPASAGPPRLFARIAERGGVAGDLGRCAESAAWWAWWEQTAAPGERALAGLFRGPPRSVNHVDVRGDNIFLRRGRAVFVDWAFARLSYPVLDSVYWALGLEVDGFCPAPLGFARYREHGAAVSEDELRGALAFFAGYFVDQLQRATAPPPVQALRRRYLGPTFRWYAAALDLPPPELP